MPTPSESLSPILRPASSLSRPDSGLSHRTPISRPPSSASLRPVSRASTTRPSSARPSSSVGFTRPQSRFSQRTHARHAKSKLKPLAQTLVNQVTGLEEAEDPEGYQRSVEYVVKSLESTTLNKGAARVDMSFVKQQINGHALKARISMNDPISEALLTAFKRLTTHVEEREKDLDHDIQTTHFPDHLQFLLNLSQPPTNTTIAYAEQFLDEIKNPRPPMPEITWKDILADDPFEGDHWEGILDSNTRKTRDEDWESTPSLSSWSSGDEGVRLGEIINEVDEIRFEELRKSRRGQFGTGLNFEFLKFSDDSAKEEKDEEDTEDVIDNPGSSVPPFTYAHRKEFEDLQAMQYWRKDWKGYVPPSKNFDIGDPSTLGAAFADALASHKGSSNATQALLLNEKYIREEDMVREVYMALQGLSNIVLTWKANAYTITPDTPRLAHFTLGSQTAILNSLAETATTLEHLRRFRSSVFSLLHNRTKATTRSGTTVPSTNITRTVEAFADAIDSEIRVFDTWCADQETDICRIHATFTSKPDSDLVVSLLKTTKDLNDTFEHTFNVLLSVIREVFAVDLSTSSEYCVSYLTSGRKAPAMVASKLLDVLFGTVQMHLEREESVTSGRLMRVFVRTAEPVWEMCGKWLRNGMGLYLNIGLGIGGSSKDDLEEEFFIESKVFELSGEGTIIGLMHPDFWKEGYGLRVDIVHEAMGDDDQSEIRQKAVPTFLEHVAGMILSTGKTVGLIRALGSVTDIEMENYTDKWESFRELVGLEENGNSSGKLFSVSVDTLSRVIYDRLLPGCQAIGRSLVNIAVDECGLWKHLGAIEGIFLMRRGDAISHFVDIIFNRMDIKQPWSDFHFLNSAFTDVVEANINSNAGAREWIKPSLVRISYRGSKEKERMISRTVKALDGLIIEYAVPFPLVYLFRPSVIAVYSEIFVFLLQIRRAKSVLESILVRGEEGKKVQSVNVIYAMRSRLSWFINTLLNFFTTYVIHAQVVAFHKNLKEAQSFDEMIQLHDEHLNKIQGRCLLKKNTSALHRAILSILDMSLHFSEFFIAYSGYTTTHDVSRRTFMKGHRSRKQKRRRKNVIGFSQPDFSSSSSSDDDQEPEVLRKPITEADSYSNSTSMNTTNFSSIIANPEEFSDRMEKFSMELDGLVRFVRRGVESLAGSGSEAAPAFGVMAFALEDWDL